MGSGHRTGMCATPRFGACGETSPPSLYAGTNRGGIQSNCHKRHSASRVYGVDGVPPNRPRMAAIRCGVRGVRLSAGVGTRDDCLCAASNGVLDQRLLVLGLGLGHTVGHFSCAIDDSPALSNRIPPPSRTTASSRGRCSSCGPTAPRYPFPFALFTATAARMRALNASSSNFSPSRKSMARRVFPSRLELKRRAGSFTDAPLAKVSFTTLL